MTVCPVHGGPRKSRIGEMALIRENNDGVSRLLSALRKTKKKLGVIRTFLPSVSGANLSRMDRLAILEKARWTEQLDLPGYDLEFVVRSKTELSRITKFKERWTIEWINSLPEGSVLWDVGANIGIMSSAAALRNEIAQVVAIEPFFKNYSAIVENLMLNGLSQKVTVVCGGLGETTAFIPLKLQNVIEGGSLHSFGKIFQMGTRSNTPVAEQSCLCFRLDDLVSYEGIPFPTHLKIDIDGFELSMLKGAEETLADPRLKGIQVETMDHDEDVPQRRAVAGLIEKHGFRLANEITHKSDKAKVFDLQYVR